MIVITLFITVFFDIILLILIGYLFNKEQGYKTILSEMTQERGLFEEQKKAIVELFSKQKKEFSDKSQHVEKVAAVSEQQARLTRREFSLQAKKNEKLMEAKIEEFLREISSQQSLIEKMSRSVASERQRLSRLINRGEQLAKVFSSDVAYEDILSDLKIQKYNDARYLLGRGYTCEEIATDMGLKKRGGRNVVEFGRKRRYLTITRIKPLARYYSDSIYPLQESAIKIRAT